jgi:gamma-glutamyltranspeptidase / glutathione hydrolase
VPGTGLIPSNRGSQSRPDPRHPAGVAPGKRPRLTPNPALAIKGGDHFMPFGTPGGDVQSQAMLQVLLNHFVFGQDMQSAIESPRFASYSYPSSFAPYDYYPGRLAVEARIPEPVIAELARRGHEIQRWPDWIWTAGAVCAIDVDKKRGVIEAGADPRRAAYALGW